MINAGAKAVRSITARPEQRRTEKADRLSATLHVERHRRLKPELVAADAIARGLAAAQFVPNECCIKSGAFYVYDHLALAATLRRWASTLDGERIPTDSDRFVAFVAANWLEPTHAAYAVIAATFGDTV